MSTKEDDFLEQLRATFKVEAAEHLQAMATGLLELEKTTAPAAQSRLVETVFRAAHSLKGAARAVDFIQIESLCQSLEEMFAAWKRQDSVPSPAAFDSAHRVLDEIAAAMSAARELPGAPSVPTSAARPSFGQPVPSPEVVPPAPVLEQRPFSSEETVRISIAKLDARLVEAEEMLTAKLAASQRVEDLRELAHSFETWGREWAAVEPEARALRQAVERPPSGHPPPPGWARLLEFLEWNFSHVKTLEGEVALLTRTAGQDRHVVGKLVDDLLEDSKKLLLLPFATLAPQLLKVVRDLCREQGKEAGLVIRGEQVEIDKRVLEEMKDPLIHLLRNCIDHGIEPPELRARLGKPVRATIALVVSEASGGKVELLVADDGAGIDVAQVKAAAIRHGALSEEDARRLGEAEALELIFQTEVSTSPMITRLSGRGLGLAIVREKAEKLDGTVSVTSQSGKGSSFRIVLPSMLATFRGVLVEAAGRVFVAPTSHVERVARVKADDVQTVEGRETIVLGGHALALVRLADVLELPAERSAEALGGATVVVLGAAEQRIAFAVDAVLDEQEVLVKRLGKPLSRVRNIAGATVLGSGRVAPVLNVADLLKSARRNGVAAVRATAGGAVAEAGTVLVAEDSITSRMLLKSILESAGYKVKTAVDGMEAFALLRAEKFDLLVSDVEMPRLNGFDLAVRVRADKKLAELPIVLVTALETREDRERGVDVGVNAYLVKSSFDQSNLLDAVRRLID